MVMVNIGRFSGCHETMVHHHPVVLWGCVGVLEGGREGGRERIILPHAYTQDLLKYASPTHPDMVHLQMALARFDGIAQYLNEAKRRREQLSTVYYLNNRVSGMEHAIFLVQA